MRICCYNFIQPDDAENRGGGVRVYSENFVKELLARKHSVIFLSAGDVFDPIHDEPHLKFSTKAGYHRAVVVNSPVLAPMHFTFHDLDIYLKSKKIDFVAQKLRDQYGVIDAFYFQNLEGLTVSFFDSLRRAYPAARLVMMAHNYQIVCPQVNLWYRERENCQDNQDGARCVNCIFDYQPAAERRRGIANAQYERRLKKYMPEMAFRALRKSLHVARRLNQKIIGQGPAKWRPNQIKVMAPASRETFAQYRIENLRLVDKVFDEVIAVSKRTAKVLNDHGVDKSRIRVSYIGTSFHKKFRKAKKLLEFSGPLHIAYFGTMRLDKGFWFLIDMLERLPEALSEKLSVTIAAHIWHWNAVDRLRAIAHRFNGINIIEGYNHDTLEAALTGVHLGIVPVLWEDNLPQVAIEFVAHGIPVLTSNMGGAQEISAAEAFCFKAGSESDFIKKLTRIAFKDTRLAEFWLNPIRVFSPTQHVTDLLGAAPEPKPAQASLAPQPEQVLSPV